MGLIKEPMDVDFFVEPKSLSEEEKKLISSYIKDYKAKHKQKKSLPAGKIGKIKAA